MKKMKKSQRVALIAKMLSENPNRIIKYSYFEELFGIAKSSVSEDIASVKEIFSFSDTACIQTYSGTNGGVKYICDVSEKWAQEFIQCIASRLCEKNRVLPGAILYYNDIICSPELIDSFGRVVATICKGKKIDYVVTMETKGIPLAMMSARYLNVPFAIIRRESRLTDGSTVNINYVSSSSGRINKMSISKRFIKQEANVIIVDDYMRAGSTICGMMDLVNEFNCNVVNTFVLMATDEPKKKKVDRYIAFVTLKSKGRNWENIDIIPNRNILFQK